MPSRCCVTACKGNYDSSSTKVTVFKFPESLDMREKWCRAIPRKDFVPTKSSRVCEAHFKKDDIERDTWIYDSTTGEKLIAPLRFPRLKKDAIPSIFPGCPTYLSAAEPDREAPEDKKIRIENEQLQLAVKLSKEAKEAEDKKFKFSSYTEFLSRLENLQISECWSTIRQSDRVIFIYLHSSDAPVIAASIVVHTNLQLTVFIGPDQLNSLNDINLPKNVNCMKELSTVLENVQNLQDNHADPNITLNLIENLLDKLDSSYPVKFIKEQIHLLQKKKEQRRYSPDLMIFTALLHSISPHAYRFLRNSGNLIIPHPTTLRRITSNMQTNPHLEQFDSGFLKYTEEKSKLLKDVDKTVVLMFDEIHLKPYIDYKGGNVVGAAFDNEKAATSAHAFMIRSMMSTYMDVVHILPVLNICAETLNTLLKKIVIGLEKIGFTVLAVVSYNNSINRKAMSLFLQPPSLCIKYPHPVNPERPLYYVIDAVHILKCVRNNWLNQKNSETCMFYPNFECVNNATISKLETASFSTLRKLHEVEHVAMVKFGYGLTYKALNPTNLERQNVKLALQVFNEFVAKALLELGEKHAFDHFKSTASYIEIILKWWWIVNVKTSDKGRRLNNIFMHPLTLTENDERRKFLNKFITWLDIWKHSNCSTGVLTNETHTALINTSQALLDMSTYCFEKLKMKYFLTGKLQTDSLEDRFGKYRMLAGSQYNVSVRQIFESESKLRLQDYLPLTLKSSKHGNVSISKFDVDMSQDSISTSIDEMNISVVDSDFKEIESSFPVLVYMAGYCVYTICKNLKCESCREQLVMDKELIVDDCYVYTQSINRGSLQFPNADVIRIVSFCYIVAQKLLSSENESKFLRISNQRVYMINLIMQLNTNCEIFNDVDVCASGHIAEFIVRRIAWVTTNILLKNYCIVKNDIIKKSKIANNDVKSKKRKLDTLKK